MNTQGNVYTFIYASVMVVVVAAVLAYTALSLKPLQTKNIEIDKKMQILKSAHIESTAENAEELYDKYIQRAFIVDSIGEIVSEDAKRAFYIDMKKEILKPLGEQELPVYEFSSKAGEVKYILPVQGKGLWGAVWGYVSLNEDKNTIYGVYFSHKGETPGLGSEIDTPKFQNQFKGKKIFQNGQFTSIAILKKGRKAIGQDAVDAISGGTITSKGVEAMLKNCLQSYVEFLNQE